jgi:hypothetical protein
MAKTVNYLLVFLIILNRLNINKLMIFNFVGLCNNFRSPVNEYYNLKKTIKCRTFDLNSNFFLPSFVHISFLVWALDSVALVRERTIPTKGPPLVGEFSANFWG